MRPDMLLLVLCIVVILLMVLLVSVHARKKRLPLSLVTTPQGHMSSIVLLYNEKYINSKGWKTVLAPEDVPDGDAVLFVSRHDEHRHGGSLFAEHALRSNLLQRILNKCATLAHRSYVIVCGKSDYVPQGSLLIPHNVVRLYANNVAPKGKLHFFPMGRDWRAWKANLVPRSQQTVLDTTRTILCFGALTISCYRDKECTRKKYEVAFKNKSWVTWTRVGQQEFFKYIKKSKYVLCPRGNALDTFRFYDAIYAGAIPIVEREAYHHVFDEVPILFVKTADLQSLSEDFLNREYTRLATKRKSYYKALDFDYWTDEVSSLLNHARSSRHDTSWSPTETQVIKAGRTITPK